MDASAVNKTDPGPWEIRESNTGKMSSIEMYDLPTPDIGTKQSTITHSKTHKPKLATSLYKIFQPKSEPLIDKSSTNKKIRTANLYSLSDQETALKRKVFPKSPNMRKKQFMSTIFHETRPIQTTYHTERKVYSQNRMTPEPRKTKSRVHTQKSYQLHTYFLNSHIDFHTTGDVKCETKKNKLVRQKTTRTEGETIKFADTQIFNKKPPGRAQHQRKGFEMRVMRPKKKIDYDEKSRIWAIRQRLLSQREEQGIFNDNMGVLYILEP